MESNSKYIDPNADTAAINGAFREVRQQTDGTGLRMGKTCEFTLVAPVKSGGAEVFRQNIKQAQFESRYWEGKLGTVHNIRVCLINNDTFVLFGATYSDEFKPYVADVIKFASPWLDHMFLGVLDGFNGMTKPGALEYIMKYQVEAELWCAFNEEASARDVARGQRVLRAFNELLDAAQG